MIVIVFVSIENYEIGRWLVRGDSGGYDNYENKDLSLLTGRQRHLKMAKLRA
jgi:hypothetical protein